MAPSTGVCLIWHWLESHYGDLLIYQKKSQNLTTKRQKLILLKPNVATYVRVTVYSSNHNIETAFFQSLFLIYFSSRGSDQGICAINSDYNIF